VIISDIRIVNVYAPNGNPVGSDKFAYKLAWMDRQPRRMYSGSEALSLNPLMDTGRAADGRDRKLSEKS
jgi:exonuclease III